MLPRPPGRWSANLPASPTKNQLRRLMKAPEVLRTRLVDELRREMQHPSDRLRRLWGAGKDMGGKIESANPKDREAIIPTSVFADRQRAMSRRRRAEILTVLASLWLCTDLQSQFVATPWTAGDGKRMYDNRDWQELFELIYGEAVPKMLAPVRLERIVRLFRNAGYLRTFRVDVPEADDPHSAIKFRARPAYKQVTARLWRDLGLLEVFQAHRNRFRQDEATVREKMRRREAKRRREARESKASDVQRQTTSPTVIGDVLSTLSNTHTGVPTSPVHSRQQGPPPDTPVDLVLPDRLPGETDAEYAARCREDVMVRLGLK